MYDDDDYLSLSGIQHFAFCRRQWALIHIEQTWRDSLLTVQGDIMHDRAHDEGLRERRGDLLVVRGLSVRSSELGLVGKCDVVEFRQSKNGHPLFGEDGHWREIPVEYKRGRSKESDVDRLQLCAQAMCLEEMFGSEIPLGYLYYGATKSREHVDFSLDLREKVRDAAFEMHQLYQRRHTPRGKYRVVCRSCSLNEACLPERNQQVSVSDYITAHLDRDTNEALT